MKMNSVSIYRRLFARALNGSDIERFLLHSLIRLSSSTTSALTYSSNRLAISYSTSRINRNVHLVTVSSGYSNPSVEQQNNLRQSLPNRLNDSQQANVYGDDAFFIAKNRYGDFLG